MNNKNHQFSIDDISIIEVTPLMAKTWLAESNKKNRRMNATHIKRLIYQLKNHQWMINGDTICFDWDGNLIDGQHRLAAIEGSGIVTRCIVIRNLAPDCIKTKDMEVKPRNLSDLLFMDGIRDANNIAAIVSRTIALNNGRVAISGLSGTASTPIGVSVWDKYDYYYKNEDVFRMILTSASRYYSKRRSFFTKGDIGGIYGHLILSKFYKIDKVDDFFTQLYYGNETCPAITTLRDKLNHAIDSGKDISPSLKQILVIKAWNCFVHGKKTRTISYNPNVDNELWFV